MRHKPKATETPMYDLLREIRRLELSVLTLQNKILRKEIELKTLLRGVIKENKT